MSKKTLGRLGKNQWKKHRFLDEKSTKIDGKVGCRTLPRKNQENDRPGTTIFPKSRIFRRVLSPLGSQNGCKIASQDVPGAIRCFIDLRLGVETALDLPPGGPREAPGASQAPPGHHFGGPRDAPGASQAPPGHHFGSVLHRFFK